MRVLFSCVGENRPDWFVKMENLVLSLRTFGGSLSDAPFVVNVVSGADPSFVESMARLDAAVRVVEPVDRRRPTSNKLRMFELAGSTAAPVGGTASAPASGGGDRAIPAPPEFDVLVAMDCDMVVKGDIAPFVSPDRLRAVPAGRDLLSDETWRTLYRLLDLPLPARDCTTVVSGQRTYPYFNSGVLFVPRAVCEPLRAAWLAHMEWIMGPGLDQLGMDRLRKDQIPLSAALASAGLTVEPLPVNLNLSVTAARFAPPYRHQWGPPFLLHYHRLIDERGFLLASPAGRVNPELDDFNRARARLLGLPYDGLDPVPLARRARALLKDQPAWRWARRGARRAARAREGLAGRRTGPGS